MNIRKLIFYITCLSIFSIQSNAATVTPPGGTPIIMPVAATATVTFYESNMTARISWSKNSADVKTGETREIVLIDNTDTANLVTLQVYPESGLTGSRTVKIPSTPANYSVCHISKLYDEKYKLFREAKSCGAMNYIIISSPIAKNELLELDSIGSKRDFDADLWLQLESGSVGLFRTTKKILHNLTTGTTSELGVYGRYDTNDGRYSNGNGKYQIAPDLTPLNSLGIPTDIKTEKLSSGDYKVSMQNCPALRIVYINPDPNYIPIPYPGTCSDISYSDVFTIELPPAKTTISAPTISTIPSANITVTGTAFSHNSLNARYIVSKRTRVKNGTWGTWGTYKTINVATADLAKASNHVVGLTNLAHNTEHQFKVDACNSTCAGETIAPQTLAVTYPVAFDVKSTPAVTSNGSYSISWKTSLNPGAAKFYLKDISANTETQYTPTGSTVNVPFLKTINGTYNYQVKACYDIQSTLSCTEYSPVVTTTVNIQLATPTLTAPSSSTSFTVPLSWNAVSGVTGNDVYYQVYSSTNALLHTTSVGTTSWTYTAPANGTYGFQVRACVPAACSSRSATKTTSIDISPTQPSLSLSNASNGHDFTLNWSAATRANSYTLEHKYGSGSWSTLATNTSARSYNVSIPSAATPHGTHQYRVKACESSHGYCSTYSNVMTKNVDTRPTVGNITIDRNVSQCDGLITDKCFTRVGSISVAWDRDTSDLVEYYEITEVNSVIPALVLNVSGSNHINTGNIDGLNTGTYFFKYRACSNYGVVSCSDYSSSVEVQISIPTPVTQSAILSVTENGIATDLVTGPYSVEWNQVDRALMYKVYQKLHDSESFALVSTLGSSDAVNGVLSFDYSPQAPDLMAWGEHSYYVTAYNSDNNATSPAPVSAAIVITVEQDETVELRKQLYYSEADDIDGDVPNHGQYDRDNAALRYLDLMYSFNSDADIVVSDFFSGDGSLQSPRDFSELYDNAERARIDFVLTQLQENLRNAYDLVQQNDPNAATRFTRSKELLLDIFYDRAVAEIVLGNQDMDNARIKRLREEGFNNEVNDLSEAYDHYYKALSDYANLFTQVEYNYTNLLSEQFSNRKQQSPRYWQGGYPQQVIVDGSAEASQLIASYKDLAMYFELMSKVINSKVEQTKLEVNDVAVTQTQLDLMKQDLLDLKTELSDWTNTLQSKFTNTVFSDITTLDVMQAMDRYNHALVNIDNAISWINGDSNILGLNDDSLIIVNGYGLDGNQTYNSFDAIAGILVGVNNKKGSLTIAKEDFSEAKTSYENYRHNQDRLATEYADRNVQLNNLLVGLIGWEVPMGCHVNCVIRSEDAVKGSQIAIQVKRIEQADLDMETAVQRLENLQLNIEDLVDAEQIRTGIEDLMNETILDYGHEQATINQKIAKIQERVAKARKRSGLFKSAMNFGAAIVTGNYAAAAMTLVNTAGDLHVANAEIRATKDIGVLQALSTELAAAERVQINEFYTQIRQTEFDTMIRSRLRDVALLELEIEKAALSAEQEQERLIGLVSQASRLMTQIEQTNQNMADRYFADPIHASRLTKTMEKAERSFQDAQQWMFYAAQALEYKWLVDFNFNGYLTEDILRARTVTELEDIFDSGLQQLDTNKSAANAIQSGEHTLSFKEDVFGYYDRVNNVTQYYPHPAGNTTTDGKGNQVPVTLRADDAFKEALLLNKETLESGDWVKVDFNTFKANTVGTFFSGPEFNEAGCIVEGGTYLDKIESVGINVSSFFFGSETKTNAYLSYGGTSYIRNKDPGVKESTPDGIVIDELSSFPVLFWDDAENDFDRSRSIKLSASLTGTLDTSSTTTAFKERSVAASDWYLRVQLNSATTNYVELDFVDDIELIINHRYLNRNYDGNCQ